jgi:hypothetical protein
MADKKNVVGFKKFSELKSKSGIQEVDLSLDPKTGSDIPMNPNLPEESNKVERPISRKNIIPKDQNLEVNTDSDEFDNDIDLDDKKNESQVDFTGKVAKFPRNVKASKAYNFLENVKVSKKSIWYIMVEKQDSELQMVKYNVKEGVDLTKFVGDLKSYYINKYNSEDKVKKLIESIYVDGNDKYSMIKNIPTIELDGRKLITKITEDLIRLLSK